MTCRKLKKQELWLWHFSTMRETVNSLTLDAAGAPRHMLAVLDLLREVVEAEGLGVNDLQEVFKEPAFANAVGSVKLRRAFQKQETYRRLPGRSPAQANEHSAIYVNSCVPTQVAHLSGACAGNHQVAVGLLGASQKKITKHKKTPAQRWADMEEEDSDATVPFGEEADEASVEDSKSTSETRSTSDSTSASTLVAAAEGTKSRSRARRRRHRPHR